MTVSLSPSLTLLSLSSSYHFSYMHSLPLFSLPLSPSPPSLLPSLPPSLTFVLLHPLSLLPLSPSPYPSHPSQPSLPLPPPQTVVLLLAVQCAGCVLSSAVGVRPHEPALHCGLQEEDPQAHHTQHSQRLGRSQALHPDRPEAQGIPPAGHQQVLCKGKLMIIFNSDLLQMLLGCVHSWLLQCCSHFAFLLIFVHLLFNSSHVLLFPLTSFPFFFFLSFHALLSSLLPSVSTLTHILSVSFRGPGWGHHGRDHAAP